MTISKGRGWHFPKNGGGLAAGFNDSSIDHFKGHRLSSLVREVIQNSLDARVDSSRPVVVDFRLEKLDKNLVPEVIDLRDHLFLAKKTASLQSAENAVEFYDAAIKSLDDKNSITFLTVHDSNTTGLTGPISGPNGAWFALTKGSGLTQKPDNSLGSFGHGSKAPFVSSALRTVFYLSLVNDDVQGERLRFQGKSILQSHADKTGAMTQGTGFFGRTSGCEPLINEDIPVWAVEMRTRVFQTSGTSLLIPGAIWTESSLPAISLTAIANFFYAILKGVLEVNIEGLERLTAKNIVEKFGYYYEKFNEPFGEIDRDAIADALQSIQTIIKPTEHHEQQIPSFGRIEWYLRMDDEIDGREVAVARGNGMLITKKAPSLKIFRNFKPFDMFVCVTPGEGSDLLRSIENPEHTNFEFDRIDDARKRKKAERSYELFAKTIRDLVKRYAAYSTSDHLIVDDLQDLFGDISSADDKQSGSSERGNKIQIANGAFAFKPRDNQDSAFVPGDGAPETLGGRGERSGQKKAESEGGSIASEDGPLDIIGPSSPTSTSDNTKLIKLRNIRMRQVQGSPGVVKIFFDSPLTGRISVSLLRVGELSNECLSVLLNNVVTERFDIDVKAERREQIEVRFTESVADFAIEGVAVVLES